MKHFLPLLALCLAFALPVSAKDEKPKQPVIQIAILLDTSGSMEGLIDQAKSQLWKIVNEFIAVKRDGQRPLLQVALIEYGNNRLPADEKFVKLVSPLTDDLDKISEALFALKASTTPGSEEYPGAAIKAAVDRLDWSKTGADLKVVYVAGNEAFDQGPVGFRDSCKSAITRGIQVNTIFCGGSAEGVATFWKDGALLADGSFMSIDHNARVVAIEAPQDKELAELGVKINSTFVPYGQGAAAGRDNQAKQDANTAGVSPQAAAQRAVTKASANYRNGAWCLVDAVYLEGIKLEDVKEADLPEVMRKMTMKERGEYLATQKHSRETIQKRIAALNEERTKYVAEEMKRTTDKDGKQTLDAAVIGSIKKQAEAKNYKFEK
jgi:hypothetical protein